MLSANLLMLVVKFKQVLFHSLNRNIHILLLTLAPSGVDRWFATLSMTNYFWVNIYITTKNNIGKRRFLLKCFFITERIHTFDVRVPVRQLVFQTI